MWSSFTYEEPSISSILVVSTYLLLLNIVGLAAQRLLSAGLLGQILIGVIYGTPLAGWLQDDWQAALIVLGYVGLLLLVFEGGMSSSIENLAPALPVSLCIALTGLLTPIALSFLLVTPLGGSFPTVHAFAAGSALSSTSLGTVLGVLTPSSLGFDLCMTKLGTVLLSAAVIDDVVAFILVKILQVIGTGGGGGGSVIGAQIGRTIGVTIALGVATFATTRWIFIPYYPTLTRSNVWIQLAKRIGAEERLVIMLEAILFLGLVAAAGYAGTSPLYGAYIAGLAIAATSSAAEVGRRSEETTRTTLQRAVTYPGGTFVHPPTTTPPPLTHSPTSLLHSAFDTYISPLLTHLLAPIFFGSIGYCIPFVPLWRGTIIWRGIVYALIMALSKAVCGLWIVAWSRSWAPWRGAMFLGAAMVARGEIGLLIAQVAYHTPSPLFTQDEFLIVIWAIMLCTVLGPVTVGWICKRWGKRILDDGWK